MKVLVSAFLRFCAFLSILFLCACTAAGQANRASMTGTVTDSSGAVITGVDVAARNVDTNEETKSVSNEDGIYVLPNLPPGTYALTFRKDGFKEIVQPSVTLISTQVAGINVVMPVGAATENVTVTAEAPVLDSESVSIGTNMNGKVVTDLPLSIYGGGRFVEEFAVALTPGYSPISSPYGAVVNGGQWFTKEYTVDGTTATSSIRGDSMETGPSMESVEELQAQTSGLDAASAITSGGVMSFSLKSGTNQFHGSLFGYGHNEFLDANTWTNDNLGLPKSKARAWDYGASAGGPIFKDKTFFFGTFERYTQTDFTLGGPASFVPTADMLSGNFSALLGPELTDKKGNPIINPCTKLPVLTGQIFDPTTQQTVGGQTCYSPFPNNTIDPSRFSTVAQKILAIYQKSYAPELTGLNANERLPKQNSPSQTPNQAVVKLDHNFTGRDRLSGSWIYNNRPRTLVDSGGVWESGSSDGGPLSDARIQVVKSDEFRVSEAHTFSTSLLNVLNVTYNWYWNGSSSASTGTDWSSVLGFGSTGANNFPSVSFGGAINGVGVTGIGNTWQGYSTGATLITGDTFTWNKGRHSMSFGGDFRAYQINSHAGNGALSFNFVPNTTDGGYTGNAGFGFASFLLGDVTTAKQTTPFDLYGRRKSMTLFAQDSYKITPRLTLTAGLRWQYALRYHEKYGHWANFDLTQIDPNFGYPGKLVFANGGGDSFEKKEYWNGFGPQIGFAYAPWTKWVFRGSFGLTLLPPSGPYFNGVPNGFAPGFQGINSVNSPFNWDGGYPGTFQAGNQNVSPSSLFPLVSVDPHALMPAYTDTFNLGLQYELAKDLRLEVAYVGNRGHHLPDTALAFNEPSAANFLKTVNANPGMNAYNNYILCTTSGAPVTSDLNGNPLTGIACPNLTSVNSYFYGPALATIAPMPQVANWAAATWFYYNLNYVGLPVGQTSYNAMVIDLVKRGGRGWNTDVNYTYSRTRGDTFSAQQEYNGYYTPVQDFANLSQAANSLTSYDQTHVIKGFATYELPFGNGKRWLSSKGSLVNGLLGGWSLSGLVLYASGQPFQVSVNSGAYYPLWGNFYPNFNATGVFGPFNPRGYQAGGAAFHYFSSTVASSPIPANPANTPVAFGAGPANIGALRCPGIANENASLLKYTSFGADGKYQLSMRVEFYNLFNRHTYVINGCGYSTQVGAGNFGQVIGVNDSPRTGQFGVRLTF